MASNKQDDKVLIAKREREWNAASTARKEIDWRWFNYDLWVSGNHYAKYDRNTQQIITTPRSDGKPKIVINKVYATIRAIRNYVVRNEPKAEATPEDLTPENVDEAVQLNKYLAFVYKRLGLRVKLRASVWHALKYSVGYWQILWNESAEDGAGQIEVNVIDPFDLYWDPSARFPEEARYVILAVRRNIDDLKEDPKYKDVDWGSIQTDKQLAASSLKSRLLQYERGSDNFNSSKESATVILKEYWLKEKQKDSKDKDGTVVAGTTKIRIQAMLKDKIIRNELTDMDRLPFFALASDIEPLQMYGQGWVKNLVPLNRLLEKLHSSLAEYNELMNKGKWVSDKGAGVRIIDNEHGQIIEKKRGFDVHQEPIAGLSPAIYEQINFVTSMFEDISSFHDASLGRIPTGAKSGVSIEALQEGDSNNLAELTENTEVFLEKVYEYILYLASQKYQFARNVILTNTVGTKEFLKVIGESAGSVDAQGGPQNATVIPTKNVVDVKIASWLAYTSQGRQDAIKDLAGLLAAQNMPLPAKYILEAYETGNIAEIIEQIQKDQAQAAQAQQQQAAQQQQMQTQSQMQLQHQQGQIQSQQQAQQQQAQAQQAQAQNQQKAQQAQGPAPAGVQQAIAVIRQVITGHMPSQLPQQVGPDYIAYFDHYLASSEGRTLPAPILKLLQHIRDEAAATMQGGAQANPIAQQLAQEEPAAA